jgi:hypothetical protein
VEVNLKTCALVAMGLGGCVYMVRMRSGALDVAALGQMAFDKSTKGDERENLINCLCRESVYANPLWYVQRASAFALWLLGWLVERSIYCNPVENISGASERVGAKYLGCGARG